MLIGCYRGVFALIRRVKRFMVGGVGIIRLCASVLEFHFPTVAVVVAVVAVVAAVAVDYFFFFSWEQD